jgi:hypothetical protein
MAALEAATQPASVSKRKDPFVRRADARLLGGRVKPGHGEFGLPKHPLEDSVDVFEVVVEIEQTFEVFHAQRFRHFGIGLEQI